MHDRVRCIRTDGPRICRNEDIQSAMTFTLDSIPADVTNLKLVIQASDPQGNGITRAYSKAAAFDISFLLSRTPAWLTPDGGLLYPRHPN